MNSTFAKFRGLTFCGVIVGLFVGMAWPLDASETSDSTTAQTVCPVTPSEPIDPSIFTDYEGVRVFFCCQRCRRSFEADPQKYLSNLTSFGEPAGYVHADQGGDGHADHGEQAEHDATSSSTHDHARDHGASGAEAAEPGVVGRTVSWLGRLHPAVVHFPIALLIAAWLGELLNAWKYEPRLRTGVLFMVYLGAVSAVAAATLGWLNAAYGSQPADQIDTLSWHRWLGTSTALWAVVLAWQAWGLDFGGSNRAFRVNLTLAAFLVGVTGHFGGTLVFGKDFLAW